MPEEPPVPSTTPPSAETTPPEPPSKFDIGEEFGTAKKNLPPARIVLIGVVIIVVTAVIVQVAQRPRTTASGSIDNITGVEIPNQNAMMVAITVSFQNNGKKPFWIHNVQGELDTATNHYTDDAASVADFDRYFQAFPALKEHALEPLRPELKVEPGGSAKGTVIVSFPVTQQDFDSRKSLTVKIWPYDQAVPLALTK